MTDVRSMLRVSREARRIKHPHASYMSDGKLLCNLCDTVIKTEAAWQSHLHSSSHTLRSSRAKEATAARPENDTSRKRKASMSESPPLGERKRPKPAFSPGVEDGDVANGEGILNSAQAPSNDVQPPRAMKKKQVEPDVGDEAADPAALEALERELAELEAVHRRENAAQAAITISAAPMTAGEIAAQAREEQSTQRGKRDAELEAEKEDAARLLEDEFEEMEGLEERVRKLREMREALRQNSSGAEHHERSEPPATDQAEADDEEVEENEEDDDDEDFDEWEFGAR